MEVFEREVRPAVPDAQLIMVCSDAPDAPAVVCTGRIGDGELAEWYRRAWVFCLPSTYEGFGIPYAEALMAGLPVVASSNPGARYVLGTCGAGVIAQDAAIGQEIIHLLTDDRARQAASKAAMLRSERFRLSNVLDAYEEIYEALMEATRAR